MWFFHADSGLLVAVDSFASAVLFHHEGRLLAPRALNLCLGAGELITVLETRDVTLRGAVLRFVVVVGGRIVTVPTSCYYF